MPARILIVDRDGPRQQHLQREGRRLGFEPLAAHSLAAGWERLSDRPNAVVLDLALPDGPGESLLERMRDGAPHLPAVVLVARDQSDRLANCLRLGAADVVPEPTGAERLYAAAARAIERRRGTPRTANPEMPPAGRGFSALLGGSAPFDTAIRRLAVASRTDVPILLEGEVGTGKEFAARATHEESFRRPGPFVSIRCNTHPESRLEVELLGRAPTATSAGQQGAFERAHGGTLFLAGIDALPAALQQKISSVLRDGKVTRSGELEARPVDVRVIASLGPPLERAATSGRLARDLLDQLSVLAITIPPLRERGRDLRLLAEHFLRRYAARHARPARGFHAAAMGAIEGHPWPGNVRELESVVERAAFVEESELVSVASLPEAVARISGTKSLAPGPFAEPVRPDDILPWVDHERRILTSALRATGWNVQEAAQRLRIGRATVYRKIDRFGLRRPSK